MPKRKEVQNRTKGNTRPASSSRMADKLAQAGELGRFVGFDSLAGSSFLMDQTDGGPHDTHMHNEGAHFTTALRQLGKRDTTTKLKALTEFSSQCDSQSVSEVKSGLAMWPLMFNKLSTDNDHRVREATHRAMAAFLTKVRGDFQPHLKTVMGAWVAGMCDSQTSAATAAIASFTETFSADKQLQVFQFTFKEIIHYMEDIVIVQTADTYTDPKSYTKDERDRRYEMSVAMAILGVRHTLGQLSEEFVLQKDAMEPVIKKPTFLKLTKHSNPMIRGAFFRLMSAYLQKHSSGTVQDKPLCLAVFSGLRESDPSVIVHAWETILVAVDKIENWSQHVNLQKAVLPDLWSFLSSGGHGVAKKVYPPLLRFVVALSKIHPSPSTFYNQLLDRIIAGVTKDMSRSHQGEEFEAIMNAYVECYNFVVTRTLSSQGDVSEGDNPALEQIIMKISNIVSECFTVDKISRLIFQIVIHAVYNLISLLLCNHGDSVVVRAHLEQVNSCLLNDITSVVETINSVKGTQFSRVIDFYTLISSYQDSQLAVPLCSAVASDDKKLLYKFLQPVILRTCMICLSTLDEFNSLRHAKLLSLVLQQFRTKELLLTVSEMCSFSENVPAGDCLTDLVKFVLKVVVRCRNEGEEMVESVVEVLLLVMCECPDVQLDKLLVDDVEATKVMEHLSALVLLKKNQMGLELGNLPAVDCSTEKMVSYINDHSCSKVPFLWQLLETVLATPDQQIVPMDRSVAILEALCSQVSAALGRPTPLGSDDLHYCKLIWKADTILLKKVVADLHDLLFKLLLYVCDHCEDSIELSHELDICYRTISSKLSPEDYFNWLLPELLEHLSITDASLARCFGLAMKMLKFHAAIDINVLLSAMTYEHKVDAIPVAMVEKICYGKLLLQPQTISIGSFENTPTNDTIPKSLYGTVIVAVFCSSTSESRLLLNESSMVSTENLSNSLISLGLISLFLESPLVKDIDNRFCKMVKLATQKLIVKASKSNSISEVFDSLIKRCCNNYILMESMSYVLHSVEELTTEDSLSLQSTLIGNVPLTQLCTRLSGICIADELKDKIVKSHSSTDNDNVVDGLAISLLLTQLNFADNNSWQFVNDQVKSMMDQQHLLEFDNFAAGSCGDMAYLSLEVFTELVTSGRVADICWDFIMCSTVTMMQLCDDKVEMSLPTSVLHCAILRLCIELDLFFANSTNQQMITEWKDFFCPAIGDATVVQFKHILKHRKDNCEHFVAVEEFLCCKLLCRLCVEPDSHFNMSELMDHLSTGSYPVQVTAYQLLTRMMKIAIFGKKDDTVNLNDWVTTLKSRVIFFQDKLSPTPSLNDSNTVGYMLSWLLCISYLRDTSHNLETHMEFLEWTKESGAAQALVCELITHIPLQSFSSHDQIEVTPTADITNLSMITFKAVAQQLPVALRQWFITLDRKAGNIVEDFTKKYITPLLWKDQVASFEASPKSFDNMEVRLGKETHEVMINYRIDDTAGIELVVLLSDAHPLYLPTITQERGIKVNIGNWKKWILQLNSYIGNQNGTLLQGLAIWKANLDKHFAGMEDCMICFSVIHHSNQSLPRLTCKTCKKKFHNICLYKWFSTSTKSTCPLCRNIF